MPVQVRPEAPQKRYAGVAQLVERQPSKLNVASSTLVSRSILLKMIRFIFDVQNANKKGENKKISTFRSADITIELIHYFVWAFMVRKVGLEPTCRRR